MPKTTPTPAELIELDRVYREGGLRTMASPHVHYDDPSCPHSDCGHSMGWIDCKLELHGDPAGISRPLVRSWWEGTGFVRRCPHRRGWGRFTTLGMTASDDDDAARGPRLPDGWEKVAQIA